MERRRFGVLQKERDIANAQAGILQQRTREVSKRRTRVLIAPAVDRSRVPSAFSSRRRIIPAMLHRRLAEDVPHRLR